VGELFLRGVTEGAVEGAELVISSKMKRAVFCTLPNFSRVQKFPLHIGEIVDIIYAAQSETVPITVLITVSVALSILAKFILGGS
jgi:hypothetical protein